MKPDRTSSAPKDRSADVEGTQTIAPPELRPSVPSAIGRYRIVRLIGEGGMGTIYEAEQENPRRTVALKVIKAAWASPQLLRRFEQEAQALARLQHPGIAQIYEAGASDRDSGLQPYFAMEFIANGERLTSYADSHKLKVRDRLELMCRVCDAAHHAHQRGIIHRDLKPANIVVDDRGQPKILDFGVARITDSDAYATRQTDMGQLIGTLAYMSPEQVLADPLALDVRSDVYALGVILYELLAGKLPYSAGRNRLHEAVQVICEEDPIPLSSIERGYRGDIETIVAKALEKDKARRYGSAAELAADIRRHLEHQPIVARPSTTMYQLEKFVARHKALVAGLVAAFLLLVLGAAASTWQAVRAIRAEKLASERLVEAVQARNAAEQQTRVAQEARLIADERTQESQQARQIADSRTREAQQELKFLIDTFGLADPQSRTKLGDVNGRDVTVAQALQLSLQKLDSGYFADAPLTDAAIRMTIGETMDELGQSAAAELVLRRALRLRETQLPPTHADVLRSRLALADCLHGLRKFAEAENLVRSVLARSQQLPQDYVYIDALFSLSSIIFNRPGGGNLPETEKLDREALQRLGTRDAARRFALLQHLANSLY